MSLYLTIGIDLRNTKATDSPEMFDLSSMYPEQSPTFRPTSCFWSPRSDFLLPVVDLDETMRGTSWLLYVRRGNLMPSNQLPIAYLLQACLGCLHSNALRWITIANPWLSSIASHLSSCVYGSLTPAYLEWLAWACWFELLNFAGFLSVSW